MSEQKHTLTPPPWIMMRTNRGIHLKSEKALGYFSDWHKVRSDQCPEADANLALYSSNAIQNAAHRLGLDPLELAERLEDGGIAELVNLIAEFQRHNAEGGIDVQDHAYATITEAAALYSKIIEGK